MVWVIGADRGTVLRGAVARRRVAVLRCDISVAALCPCAPRPWCGSFLVSGRHRRRRPGGRSRVGQGVGVGGRCRDRVADVLQGTDEIVDRARDLFAHRGFHDGTEKTEVLVALTVHAAVEQSVHRPGREIGQPAGDTNGIEVGRRIDDVGHAGPAGPAGHWLRATPT